MIARVLGIVLRPGSLCADNVHTGESNYMLQPVKILMLAPGQEIKLRAIARKGVGKDHAKWMPVATVAMARVPEIKLNVALMTSLTDAQKREFVESCPQKVFRISPVNNMVRPLERTLKFMELPTRSPRKTRCT